MNIAFVFMAMKMIKYLKMLMPRLGTFTNGSISINGICWFGKVCGSCVYSRFTTIAIPGDFVIFDEYALSSDRIPSFKRKT